MNGSNQGREAEFSLEALLDRVKRGEKLSTSERLAALEALEERGALSAPALAKLLGVTERCIRKDRARLRKLHAELARRFNILGEAFRQYHITLAMIDSRLNDANLTHRERIGYLKERRETITAFLDRLTAFRLEDALRHAKAAQNGDLTRTAEISAN